MRKMNGASIAQYVIIIAILLLGIIPCFVMIGETISNEFNKFSNCLAYQSEIYDFKPFKVTTPVSKTETKGDYSINTHEDGAVSVVFGKQTASIPASLYNEAVETMGSAGVDKLIDEIASIMRTNGVDYAGDVPLEITFGKGTREENYRKRSGGFFSSFGKNQTAVYEGSAAANTATIRMGNQLTIMQTDQSCKGNGCKSSNMGTYKIKGSIDDQNNYNAVVYGPAGKEKGTYTAKVNYDNGITLENTQYKPKLSGLEALLYGKSNFDWDIDFYDNRSDYGYGNYWNGGQNKNNDKDDKKTSST